MLLKMKAVEEGHDGWPFSVTQQPSEAYFSPMGLPSDRGPRACAFMEETELSIAAVSCNVFRHAPFVRNKKPTGLGNALKRERVMPGTNFTRL
ncbi:hypothetical protein EVAR_5088_1 [Eumeta japonica]|uniref:Uncharacterized protein n=1 Tax=Eumeta variegata TaxID=151549 RepID=A0A4C1SX78_EUMVA|nr:hypothetical protein EVAR_5088_1 [Eumeta japonica]